MPFDAAGVLDEPHVRDDLTLLREARAAIAAKGAWQQSDFGYGTSSRCAIGWLTVDYDPDSRADFARAKHRAKNIAEFHLVPVLPGKPPPLASGAPDYVQVTRWNDAVDRRQRQVVALFDRAIRRAEKRMT